MTTVAAGAAARNFADDPQQQQQLLPVQQVVQHNNDEQVQAVATYNPQLVSDTVTGDYAQQLISGLQGMLTTGGDDHVTGIQLLNLQWGPANVAADGQSATVTTFETWRVLSTAGQVDDEPTRNDYTLVMDNGTWKIKSDTQTVGAPTPSATNTPFPTQTPTALPATPSPTATSTPMPTPTVVPTATPAPEDMAPPDDGVPPDQGVPPDGGVPAVTSE